MSKKSFTVRLTEAVDALAKRYPIAEITSGYVGNITSKYDDRVYYIWSKLPLMSVHNGRELLKWGGVPVDDESGMQALAEFAEKRSGLERAVRWSLRLERL